jgi:hypothetical protein
MAVGLDDLSKPSIIKEVEIAGTIKITSIVGEIIYIVAENLNNSFNVTPPDPPLLEKIFFEKGNYVNAEVPPLPVQDTAPESTIFIVSFNLPDLSQVEEKKINGYLSQNYKSSEKVFLTVIESYNFPSVNTLHYLDISDPSGKIILSDSTKLEGDTWPIAMNFHNGYFHVISSGQGGHILSGYTITAEGKFELVNNLFKCLTLFV